MFAREYRLPSSITFPSESLVIRTPLFLLKIVSNNLSHNRYGFVISKKVDKRAVERNRVRRLFSSILENLKIEQKGHDLLVVISPQAKGQNHEMIQSHILTALKKGGIQYEI